MRRNIDGMLDEDVERVVRRLEVMFATVNDHLLEAAGITQEDLVPKLAEVQAKLLGFDLHTQKHFIETLEERRVYTLGGGSVFAACVLCAAVALSEFKRQPRKLSKPWSSQLARLQRHSTSPAALLLFSAASFSALFGGGGLRRLGLFAKNRPVKIGHRK